MSRLVATTALMATLAGVAIAAALAEIPSVSPDSTTGFTTLTLTVDAARITVADGVAFSTRAYSWNGRVALQGPVINLQKGGRLKLTLINNLVDDSALDATKPMNTFRHANTTNMHTHGLHVDPAIDSVFRLAAPGGGTLNFDLPIPADHAPGLHWYHSHTHGAATMQIMGGLVGALYVLPIASDNVPTAISSLTSHVLVLQFLNFQAETQNGVVTHTCDPGVAGYSPFKSYSFAELEAESGSLLASSPTYFSTDRTFWTINGQLNPTITMAPGESRVLKMVYAAGTKNPNLVFPSACTVVQLSADGVYFDTPRTITYFQMIVASRAELVVTCAAAGTYVSYLTITGNTDTVRLTGGVAALTFAVTGTTVTSATIPATLGVTKPSYLTDMQSMTTFDTTNSVSLDQGGHEACKFVLGMGTNGGRLSFVGEKGLTSTASYRFTMRVGQTTEWTIVGRGNTPHPLHIHVNHFQIISYSGATSSPWFQIGEWRDTLPILDGTTKIRFRADTYPGETVLHCHELNHEDKGLMDTFLIQPALGATTTVASTTTTTVASSTTTTAAVVTTQVPSPTSSASGQVMSLAVCFAVVASFVMMM